MWSACPAVDRDSILKLLATKATCAKEVAQLVELRGLLAKAKQQQGPSSERPVEVRATMPRMVTCQLSHGYGLPSVSHCNNYIYMGMGFMSSTS